MSLNEPSIDEQAPPRLRTQQTDDNLPQLDSARSARSVDREEEIRNLVKSINSKEMNLLLQSVRDEIQFRVQNEMEKAQKQLSENMSMRSSKERSTKGEFILEQDSEHDHAQEKLNKLKEISMKIDSGRKRALDASSRNSESPEKRRMSRTGDDAPFRKSFGGSENE